MVPWFFRLLIMETNYRQLSQLKVYFKDAEVSISVNLGKSWANKFRGKNRNQGSPGASALGIHGSSLWRSGSQCGAGISSAGDIWLHLEMFLIVLTRRLFDTNIWWVEARGEGCWQTSFNAQDSLPTKSQNTEFSELQNYRQAYYWPQAYSKESACNTGDPSSILGSGRAPGGGHGNPL